MAGRSDQKRPARSDPLEGELESELDDPWAGRCTRDLAEIPQRDVTDRIGVIDPIEQVEELEPHLAANILGDRDELDH